LQHATANNKQALQNASATGACTSKPPSNNGGAGRQYKKPSAAVRNQHKQQQQQQQRSEEQVLLSVAEAALVTADPWKASNMPVPGRRVLICAQSNAAADEVGIKSPHHTVIKSLSDAGLAGLRDSMPAT
jgi:hypothetical protein